MSTSNHAHLNDNCIFCKIIRNEIPSFKLIETDKSYAFMDIEPLSKGHALVIPKYHAEFIHQVPNDYLVDMMPVIKDISLHIGCDQFNVLQNNGKLANQAVPHVHFHIIPKHDKETGLRMNWKPRNESMEDIKVTYEEIKDRLLKSQTE
ncbi:HIT-like domain-containing protein [Pilobolus umbonatus]|nr:HIT-like domain-containing protein [Pilobolus umbonatus]